MRSSAAAFGNSSCADEAALDPSSYLDRGAGDGICWNMLEWCFLKQNKQNGELLGGVKKVHVIMSCCHVSKMCHVQAMSTP